MNYSICNSNDLWFMISIAKNSNMILQGNVPGVRFYKYWSKIISPLSSTAAAKNALRKHVCLQKIHIIDLQELFII